MRRLIYWRRIRWRLIRSRGAAAHIHLLDPPGEPELTAVAGTRRAEAVPTAAQALARERESDGDRNRNLAFSDLLSIDE